MKKTKNNLCFLILISVLLLGTCLGNIQAGLVFAHSFSASADVSSTDHTTITPAGKNLPIQIFLNKKGSASQETAVHIKRSSQRPILHSGRTDSALLSSIEQLRAGQNPFSFYTVCDHIQTLLGHMVIIHYIHHQDGQKSYIPFSLTY